MPRLSARFWMIASGAAVVVLAVLLLVVLVRTASVEMPYSTFVAQVRAGNVEHIDIRGGEVTGVLRKPVFMPDEDPATAAGHTEFSTAIPTAMTDMWLYPLLDQKDTIVTISPPATAWYAHPLLWSVPLLVLLALLWVGLRWSSSGRAVRPTDGQATARAPQPEIAVIPESQPAKVDVSSPELETAVVPLRFSGVLPQETFADVVGQDQAKQELRETLALVRGLGDNSPLQRQGPRGAVLVGAHGTGKTLLARAIAGEMRRPLFRVDLPDSLEAYAPQGTLILHELFATARAAAPAVLFVDGLDALGDARLALRAGGPPDRATELLATITAEMDRIEPGELVFVVGAVCDGLRLNPALLRPGRFGRPIHLHLPDRAERLEILRQSLRGVALAEKLDLEGIARRSAGLSGVDLQLLADRAAWQATRDGRNQVTQEDFGSALAHLVLSNSMFGQVLSGEELRVAAYHEAGHVLLSLLLSGRVLPPRLSVLPDNEWVRQYVAQIAERGFQTKTALLARLTVILAGRTAEEIATGDVSTGAEEDLEAATLLARHMVARWGMSDLGPVSFPLRQRLVSEATVRGAGVQFDCSEASAAQIDRAVRVLLEDRHAVARHILKRNNSVLDHLATLLAREETIQGEALTRLMDRVSSAASLDEPRAR